MDKYLERKLLNIGDINDLTDSEILTIEELIFADLLSISGLKTFAMLSAKKFNEKEKVYG